AHVSPENIPATAISDQNAENSDGIKTDRYMSRGLTRGLMNKSVVVLRPDAGSVTQNQPAQAPAQQVAQASLQSGVTALAGGGRVAGQSAQASPATGVTYETAGATALAAAPAPVEIDDLRAEAKAKGYEGEACGACGNFTLIRNGTCFICDTCGGTTGCS
ncbi:MAG: vitamin B12-dependent ribonucleotide reductase, partial [Pseudomonadota bacterium]